MRLVMSILGFVGDWTEIRCRWVNTHTGDRNG